MRVDLESVSVSLGTRTILQDINMRIPANSSTAIIGMSGTGKTTLLRTIAGLTSPSQGLVRLGDKSPHEVYGNGAMAFLFQEASLWRHLTASQTLALTFRLCGKTSEPSAIRALLSRVGLLDFSNEYPHRMSVGMKARLNIARAFCVPPSLLLMDEPFAALDPMRRLDLNKQVDKMRREAGCGVIWVTHDVVEAIQFATHILALSPLHGYQPQMFTLESLPDITDPASLPSEALTLRDQLLEAITTRPIGNGDVYQGNLT